MKIQLLLRRVDPLGVGSDDPAAERAHEPTAIIGALNAVARSATTAGSVFHRSSSAAATAAAT